MSLITNTIAFVKKTLSNAEGGHDWFHVERVWKTAQYIAKKEGSTEQEVIALGALLHDIADAKFHGGDEQIGPQIAAEFLKDQKVCSATIHEVIQIIKHISFKGGNNPKTYTSKALDIVQDADRLDALGAIGIARTFNYGGFKGHALYNPEIPPNLNMTKAQYKNSTAPTINHFYEKLLLLKDRMNTQTGKVLAQERHQFMELYLKQFYKEWEGNFDSQLNT